MKKTIAALALLFVMFTNLNATEAPTQKTDANCTVEKCKIESKENNCTTSKCKTEKKKHCDKYKTNAKKNCSRDANKTANTTTPKWSVTKGVNSKMSACCKNKKNKEVKVEPKEEKPMKCAAGKCGGK